MENIDGSQEHKNGPELDEIDLLSIMNAPESKEADGKPGKKFRLIFKSANVAKFKIALIIGGIVLSLTFVYLLWGQRFIKLPFIDGTSAKLMSQRIASIGPMISGFGKNEYIKMTVEIECDNTHSKDKVLKLEQRIKDRIMLMMNDPEISQKVSKRDFNALKPIIKKEVERMLKESRVEGVYFSQITLY